MAEKFSIRKQVETAKREIENKPEWLRRATHLEGYDSTSDRQQGGQIKAGTSVPEKSGDKNK